MHGHINVHCGRGDVAPGLCASPPEKHGQYSGNGMPGGEDTVYPMNTGFGMGLSILLMSASVLAPAMAVRG